MKKENVVGKNIKEVRIERNMTQTELARRMGYKDKSAISKIENGENDVKISVALKFAEVLSCSKERILGWSNSIDKSEKAKVFDMIYNALDGDMPTEEELENLKRIRRLDAYNKAIFQMMMSHNKEGDAVHETAK